jgi:predicted  nucleic acid-binding Zn ribbon protein
MYVHQIEFHFNTEEIPDTLSDIANDYLAALRMNGQICGREWSFHLENNRVITTVLTPGHNALSEQFNNHYIQNYLVDAKNKGISIISHLLSEEIDSLECCTCSDSSAYILFTDYKTLESPIRCLDCFNPVPLYKFPIMPSGEYYEIICWQSDYQSCDSLQMNCTVLEKSATLQMANIQSNLSKQGIEVCGTLSMLSKKPFYYYLYHAHGRSLASEKKRCCPICKEPWYVEHALYSIFHFKCDRCFLLSNLAWNISA